MENNIVEITGQKEQLMTMIKWAQEQEKVNDKTNHVLVEHDEKLVDLGNQIIDLRDNSDIQRTQAKELQRHGAIRIHEILPTKKEYVIYRHKFFGRMWSEYKKHFDVPSYTQTRRKDYQAGLDFVDAWAPNIQALKDECDEEKRIQEQERLRTIFAARDDLEAMAR